MKRWIIFFGLLTLLFTLSFGCSPESPRDEMQRLFSKISNDFVEKMRREEGMYALGRGGSLTGGENGDKVREFGMYFQSKRLVNLDQARGVVLQTAKTLLDMINSNEQIRPHLVRYPYDASGLSFIFTFTPYEADRPSTSANYVSTVFFSEFGIKYFYLDPSQGKDVTILKESYKEALERNAQSPLLNSDELLQK